jgi:hypothetical protein
MTRSLIPVIYSMLYFSSSRQNSEFFSRVSLYGFWAKLIRGGLKIWVGELTRGSQSFGFLGGADVGGG